MTEETSGSSPPYVSHKTLLSQIERMETEGVPSKIDKHFLIGMAGGTQNHFRHALRALGLIDDDSRPTQLLYGLVDARGEERGKLFGETMFTRFPELAQLPQNASKSDFFAVLEGYGVRSPDQRRKMLAFHVAVADGAGMTVSQHIRPTKARTGPRKPRTNRTRRRGPVDTSIQSDGTEGPSGGGGDTYSVELASGGSVSVVVSVNLFTLTKADRKFVIDLVDALREYNGGDSPSSGEADYAGSSAAEAEVMR
jgi:hypothetical protein